MHTYCIHQVKRHNVYFIEPRREIQPFLQSSTLTLLLPSVGRFTAACAAFWSLVVEAVHAGLLISVFWFFRCQFTWRASSLPPQTYPATSSPSWWWTVSGERHCSVSPAISYIMYKSHVKVRKWIWLIIYLPSFLLSWLVIKTIFEHDRIRAERLIKFKPTSQCNRTQYANRKGCD